VHPIAAAAASTGTTDVAPAVAVVVGVIAVWFLSTHGKGTASARFIAWLLLPAVLWVILAVHNPAQAGHIASGTASGVAVAISALSRFAAGL
jgi:hypothetical protein